MAATPTIQKLMTLAGKFVAAQEGTWDHEAWEGLLAQAVKLGLEPSEVNQHRLGMILELSRELHQELPAPAPKKKAPARKKKTAPKKSPKRKKKAKA